MSIGFEDIKNILTNFKHKFAVKLIQNQEGNK